MGFANCLLWRQKTPYAPYASYGTACKPLPGRLPRPYHHLPHKAPATAPPCAERPWAKKVMRSARGSSNLFLLLAVILSLLMCAAAALRPEAFSSGLLKHGRARRVRMRLSLRGHGSAPIKSWDELAVHKAGLPGFSTPPSVVHEGAGEQPPAVKATAEDLSMGPSGGDGMARNATAVSVATAPQLGDLISLLRGDAQRGRPKAVGEVPAKVAAGASSSGVTAADAGIASELEARPVLAAVAQPPPADPATAVNPADVPGGAAADAAAATEPAGKPADTVQVAKPADPAVGAAAAAKPSGEQPEAVTGAAAAATATQATDFAGSAAVVLEPVQKAADSDAGAAGAGKPAEPSEGGTPAAKPMDTAGGAAAAAELAVKQTEPGSDAAKQVTPAGVAASAAELAAKQADPASGAAAELELAANLANPAAGAAGSGEPAAKPADPAVSIVAAEAAVDGDALKATAVRPPPADGAAASATAVELARVQAREEAIAEVNRPFDEEYDDDFEGEAGRQKKRRPGLVMFGDGEEGVL